MYSSVLHTPGGTQGKRGQTSRCRPPVGRHAHASRSDATSSRSPDQTRSGSTWLGGRVSTRPGPAAGVPRPTKCCARTLRRGEPGSWGDLPGIFAEVCGGVVFDEAGLIPAGHHHLGRDPSRGGRHTGLVVPRRSHFTWWRWPLSAVPDAQHLQVEANKTPQLDGQVLACPQRGMGGQRSVSDPFGGLRVRGGVDVVVHGRAFHSGISHQKGLALALYMNRWCSSALIQWPAKPISP